MKLAHDLSKANIRAVLNPFPVHLGDANAMSGAHIGPVEDTEGVLQITKAAREHLGSDLAFGPKHSGGGRPVDERKSRIRSRAVSVEGDLELSDAERRKLEPREREPHVDQIEGAGREVDLKATSDPSFDERARNREADAAKLEELLRLPREPCALELLIVFELQLRSETDSDPVVRLPHLDSYRSKAGGQLPIFRHRCFVELSRARLSREGVPLVILNLRTDRAGFSSDLEGSLLLQFFLVFLVQSSLDAVEVAVVRRAPLPLYLGRRLLFGLRERRLSAELLIVFVLAVGLDQPRAFFLRFLRRRALTRSLGEHAAGVSEHKND